MSSYNPSYKPNWTFHFCGGKRHGHMDLPKKNEWDKFRHSSHSQIKDDGEEENETATTISDVTKITGLGDMAK